MRLIAKHSGKKHMLFSMSHTVVDGQDFAWLWDCDIEEIVPDVLDAICCGNKAEELALRLKYAEFSPSKISVIHEYEGALEAALKNVEPGGSLYILSGYTPTQELRKIMQKHGWVKHYWEE